MVLKMALTSALVLKIFDVALPTHILADISGFAVSSMLE